MGPRACVIGYPVAHSRSPMLHGHWLRALGLAGEYGLAEVRPEALGLFVAGMRAAGYVGANVTVPHKQAVARLVARCDAAAEAIGAVNTLWFEGEELVGGNTDAVGFVGNLDDRAPGWDGGGGGRAVILGAGGAARAAVHGLLGRGFTVDVVNRTGAAAEALARHFGPRVRAHDAETLPRLLAAADLLVNTTSLGMLGKAPLEIDLAPLPRAAVVHDVVYVPLETPLLAQARRRGHVVVDGLGMLLQQAKPGFARWFGVTPVVSAELRALVEADIRARTPGA
jgi:shikimate dehydrogenase